ncbi:MAG: VWA domain-containing protein [Acidilobaceae archaeon]
MRFKKSTVMGVGVLDELKMYRGERVIRTVIELRNTLRGDLSPKENAIEGRGLLRPELATDLFYVLNLPIPMLEESEENEEHDDEYIERYNIIAQLLKNPKLHRIRVYTVADSLVSTVAAASILDKLVHFLSEKGFGRKDSSENESDEKNSSKDRSGLKSDGEGDALDSLEDVLNEALDQALRDTETAKKIKSELLSKLAGTGSVLSFEDSAEEVLKLARLTDIAKILERIEGLDIPGVKGKKIRFRKGWAEGIEIGSDLERLHYSQLALPSTYFMIAFAESRLLLYSKHEEVSRGPIYVLLDKSGSMVGEKIDWARAVAVALLKRAIGESRAFYARYFDSVPYELTKVKSNPYASEVVRALLSLAKVTAGGGTDIMRAVLIACNDIVKGRETKGVSDIILISDGEDKINVNVVKSALSKANARLHTVMIHGNNQDLREVSYRYLKAERLENSDIIKVVDFH